MISNTIVNICIYLLILLITISIIFAILSHYDVSIYIYITYILWIVMLSFFYLVLPTSSSNYLNITN
jgi:hypothetical protein